MLIGERRHFLVCKGHITKARMIFDCDCGKEVILYAAQLRGGRKSCGCVQHAPTVARNTTHGLFGHPLYDLWNGMKARCYDPNHVGYRNYGGRGIRVVVRWHSFENFVADMGPRPEGTTLDRERVDEHYGPDNCRWATSTEQAENTSRNRYLEVDGLRLTVSQWARRLGIEQRTLNRRRALGWSDEAVVKTPIGGERCS